MFDDKRTLFLTPAITVAKVELGTAFENDI